jgi:hypothetical protein
MVTIAFMALFLASAYYDLFRMRLAPNIFALAALPLSIFALVTYSGSWPALTVAGVVILACGLLRIFAGADFKWLMLALPLFGPIDTAWIYLFGMVFTLIGSLPWILQRMKKRQQLKGMPVPLLPGFWLAALMLTGNITWIVVGTGAALALVAYGLYERSRHPLPTLTWLVSAYPDVVDWKVLKGEAWADERIVCRWTSDRHRIFLSSILTDEGYKALWRGQEWKGEAGSWLITLQDDGTILLRQRSYVREAASGP